MDQQPEAGSRSHGISRFFVSWIFLLGLAVAALLLWDFSGVIFVKRQRERIMQLVKPGMRLTAIERKLNEAHYTTLYLSPPGSAPALLVTGSRHAPYSLQWLRGILPGWHAPEHAMDALLERSRFLIPGNSQGLVALDDQGAPLSTSDLPTSAMVPDPLSAGLPPG